MPKLCKNIMMSVALAAIAAQTVAAIVKWPEFVWAMLLCALLGIGGVMLMRFSYKIAERHNRLHSRWDKKTPDSDFTPSRFAVAMNVVYGAVVLCISEACFIVVFVL